jgi:ribosomal protein S18 acetylase RimI-like enzyme
VSAHADDGHQGVVRVVAIDAVTDTLVAAIARLVPQLSSSAPPPTATELAAIVGSDATTLFVAELTDGSVADGSAAAAGGPADGPGHDDGDARGDRVVGSLTLALFRLPTGVRAWIEDVVVDERARGRGVGEALVQAALAQAAAAGATSVDLTSRPSREAANRLYQRLGFQARQTNVYRYQGA